MYFIQSIIIRQCFIQINQSKHYSDLFLITKKTLVQIMNSNLYRVKGFKTPDRLISK